MREERRRDRVAYLDHEGEERLAQGRRQGDDDRDDARRQAVVDEVALLQAEESVSKERYREARREWTHLERRRQEEDGVDRYSCSTAREVDEWVSHSAGNGAAEEVRASEEATHVLAA